MIIYSMITPVEIPHSFLFDLLSCFPWWVNVFRMKLRCLLYACAMSTASSSHTSRVAEPYSSLLLLRAHSVPLLLTDDARRSHLTGMWSRDKRQLVLRALLSWGIAVRTTALKSLPAVVQRLAVPSPGSHLLSACRSQEGAVCYGFYMIEV